MHTPVCVLQTPLPLQFPGHVFGFNYEQSVPSYYEVQEQIPVFVLQVPWAESIQLFGQVFNFNSEQLLPWYKEVQVQIPVLVLQVPWVESVQLLGH